MIFLLITIFRYFMGIFDHFPLRTFKFYFFIFTLIFNIQIFKMNFQPPKSQKFLNIIIKENINILCSIYKDSKYNEFSFKYVFTQRNDCYWNKVQYECICITTTEGVNYTIHPRTMFKYQRILDD